MSLSFPRTAVPLVLTGLLVTGCSMPGSGPRETPTSTAHYAEEFDGVDAPKVTSSTPSSAAPSSTSEFYGEDQHFATCRRLAWIGDSLSMSVWGEGITKYGKNMKLAVPDVLAQRGVDFLITDTQAGRTITDRTSVRATTGIDAIKTLPEVDCLVMALGTGDAVAAEGRNVGKSSKERIDAVNEATGDMPVLWFPVAIDKEAGKQGPDAAVAFNKALNESGAVMIEWKPDPADFTDGLHLTPEAYLERVDAAAKALPD